MLRQQTGRPSPDRVAAALWFTILLAVAGTPLVVFPGMRDPFRVPEAIFFQALMLLTVGGMIAWLLVRESSATLDRIMRLRLAVSLALATVAWTALVSVTAVAPVTARYATLAVFCHAGLFIATIIFARGTSAPLAALLIPAVANALFTILQELRIWSPIRLQKIPEGRNFAMGLLGNPDYIGTYLIVPCVAAIAAALAFRRHRALFAVIAAVLLGGLFFCQSVTAIGAMGVALLSFSLVVRSTKVRMAIVAMLMLVVIALSAYGPTRTRALQLRTHMTAGRLNELTSLRLTAFVAAADMFRERPLLGAGPGGFAARYMSFKLAADERYPQWMQPHNENFGEAHNDHLQLLAETGLPGYLLFLAALAQFAAISLRKSRGSGERAEYARLFALPAAVGFVVVALGQFPLHLPSTTSSAVFAAALAHLWSNDASS